MDLREVIERVKIAAESAFSSFHAGRRDDAEKYLGTVRLNVEAYFDAPAMPAGDVTDSATSEKPAEPPEAKPAEVPGAPAHPGAVDPAAAARQYGGSLTDEKPTQ